QVNDSEGLLASAWDGEKNATELEELADGRVVSVARSRLANGGCLITYEDITERQRLDARLADQHELLREHEALLTAQNLQLDAALNNMVQGLAMFDTQYRLVLSNRRYREI